MRNFLIHHLHWHVLLGSTVVGGLLLGLASGAMAQRRPIADETLGNERSRVVPLDSNPAGDRIEGGAQRGNNLFHSFQEFNVEEGRSVYFADPGVENILGRVTGLRESQVLGVLGVLGNANLFLINPNGIVFGANAQLDLRGSFTATTADAIRFGEQGFFSTTESTAPPLLTVQPTAFLFNHLHPAAIANYSTVPAAINPSGIAEFGLQVPPGERLTLLGGDIRIDGGGLVALNGRVEVGGLSQPGTVSLKGDGSLRFPDGVGRSAITLANQARINVVGDSGSIAVNAGDLEVLDSTFSAGIGANSNSVSAQAGDITLNARAIRVRGKDAAIANRVRSNGVGNAGAIRITTESLVLTDGVELLADTLGQGNAGNVIINASDRVVLDDAAIYSNVDSFNSDRIAVGDGGDISITTGSLSLTNGSRLDAATLGQGNAGNVVINARDRIDLDQSVIFTSVIATQDLIGIGNGGNIRITTGSLFLTNGTQLLSGSRGQGNAGNVMINARDRIDLDGENPTDSSLPTLISSGVSSRGSNRVAVGNGGDIRITTGSLFLTRGASLRADTAAQGNAGNVIVRAHDRISLDGVRPADPLIGSSISSNVGSFGANNAAVVGNGGDIRLNTGSLSLTNGAQINAVTLGQGNAGNVIIHARDRVLVAGVSPTNSTLASGILSTVGIANLNTAAVGNGGNIQITAGSLNFTDGALLSATTLRQGNAGNILLRVPAGSLSLTDGAQLVVSSRGQGNAGNVVIHAGDRVLLDGNRKEGNASAIFSSVRGVDQDESAAGEGGDIRITANSLILRNGAGLTSATLGQGNAGNIIINARDRISLEGRNRQQSGSTISSSTQTEAQGRGGDIRIAADRVRLSDGGIIASSTRNRFSGGNITINANTFEAIGGAQVNTATNSRGRAGNIVLNASDRITLSGITNNEPSTLQGNASGLYASTAQGSTARSGTIQITTDQLEVRDRARIAVDSQGSGIGGDIDLTASTIQLEDGARLTAETAARNGGNIRLRDVGFLQLQDNSLITTTAGTNQTSGNGGNVDINSDFIVAFPGNSDIRANAFTGRGGNVRISTNGLFGIATQSRNNPLTNDITASSEQGVQGVVDITRPDSDPKPGLAELPVEVVDASDRITQSCSNRDRASGEFRVTGRGGLPPSPTDALMGDESLAHWSTLENATEAAMISPIPGDRTAPLMEAQGMVIDENGRAQLVAAVPTRSASPTVTCR